MKRLLLLGALGCHPQTNDTADRIVAQPLTLKHDVQPLMNAYCNEICHQGSANNFSMLPGEAYAEVVDVPAVQAPFLDRVEPGVPELSYMIHKLRDTHTEAGGMGESMPRYSTIPEREIRTFEEWVADGALP